MGNYFFVYIIIQQHYYTAAAIGYNKQVPLRESTKNLTFLHSPLCNVANGKNGGMLLLLRVLSGEGA